MKKKRGKGKRKTQHLPPTHTRAGLDSAEADQRETCKSTTEKHH